MSKNRWLIAVPFIGLALALFNLETVHHPLFGLVSLAVYLGGLSLALGSTHTRAVSFWHQLAVGIMMALASICVLSSLVYYSAKITPVSLGVVLLFLAIITAVLAKPQHLAKPVWPKTNNLDGSLFLAGLLALLGWWSNLSNIHITEPVRSLWLVLSPSSLIALGLATFCTLTILLRNKGSWLGFSLLSLVIFSATSIAAIIYPLGYGFDPFLHRATIEHIAQFGTITPKPLYYIGQYVLELQAIKIFTLPLYWTDVLLAPVLFALLVTFIAANKIRTDQLNSFSLFALALLPLGAFIQTTPQALAFIFTVLCVLVSSELPIITGLLALAALITHPLAGISALGYWLLTQIPRYIKPINTRRLSLTLTVIIMSLSLPVAFLIQAKVAGLNLHFNWTSLWHWQNLPVTSYFSTGYTSWGDLAYFWIGNGLICLLILAALGIWQIRKADSWFIPLLAAASTFISFIIISLGFDFKYLISYERADFALRLLTLATIFLLPYLMTGLTWIYQQARPSPFGLKLGVILLLSLIMAGQTYAAYPRHDNYARSAGFNVSATDIQTVRMIDKAAQTNDYVVLTDQALAAAAVDQLGFKHYYHGDIFFYPIPTGGTLYQYYLQMVEQKPSLDIIKTVTEVTGAPLIFFAIHDYWWRADQIAENTKLLTDHWWSVNNQAVTIFCFSETNLCP